MGSSDRIDPLLAADIDRLATAFAKDPRSKAFMPLAESYIKAGMWQEAAGVLEDGLAVSPGFVTAMAALGRVYDQLGQPVKAKAILEEVVRQSPENLRAHRILARIFSSEGKAESALKSCSAILAVNPYDEEALSIQHTITGRSSDELSLLRTKREKKRLKGPQEEKSSPSQPAAVSSESVLPSRPEPTEPVPPSDHVVKTAAIVAQLEAWLKSIQSRRQSTPT